MNHRNRDDAYTLLTRREEVLYYSKAERVRYQKALEIRQNVLGAVGYDDLLIAVKLLFR